MCVCVRVCSLKFLTSGEFPYNLTQVYVHAVGVVCVHACVFTEVPYIRRISLQPNPGICACCRCCVCACVCVH